MDYRERIIQNIKDCEQSLIDNASNIVGNYKYVNEYIITCHVSEMDEMPYIDVNISFCPEGIIERCCKNE